MNKILLSFGAALLLALSACGGGGGTTATTTPTIAAGTVVTLTGTVANGTSAGGVAVGAVTGAATTIKGIYANAIIIAVDNKGNTITTSADQTGTFTISLKSGVSYGLVFLDGKTMKLLGSLVQANAQTKAGAVSLNGNGNLGIIVINPVSGKAVSSNEATGQLTQTNVVSAKVAGLKTTANGTITQTEISKMQALTLVSNPAALKTISVIDYFAKANTWWGGNKQVWQGGNAGFSYDLNVASQVLVKGPANKPVNAIRSSSVTYYQSNTWNKTTTTGYYSPNQNGSPYASTNYAAPPATYQYYSGPFTWDFFSYLDSAGNQMYDGSRAYTNNGVSGSITWAKSVAATIQLGKATSGAYSDPMGKGAFTVTITIAKENGASYILKDTKGKKHLVMLLTMKGTFTPDPIICKQQGQPANACVVRTTNSVRYMIKDFGEAQVDAVDANGAAILPSVALKGIVFGNIATNPDGTFKSAINLNPLATIPGLLTNAQRDAYLTYIWNNKDKVGTLPKNTTAPAQNVVIPSWFNTNANASGNIVTPTSYNTATGLPNILTAGGTQAFTTSIGYQSGGAATFTYEFRGIATVGAVSTFISAGTPVNAATTGNTPTAAFAVLSTLTIPTLAMLPAASKITLPNFTNPALAGTQQGTVELWLVMKDAANKKVFEQMLNMYVIQ